MSAVESVKGAFEKGNYGAIVFKNEHGTLETNKVSRGSGTFTATCRVGERVITRKMTGDKYEVCERWEKWQKRTLAEQAKKEESMAKQETGGNSPDALVEAVNDAVAELHAICDGINEIWLLLSDGQEKAQADKKQAALEGFLNQTTWLDYVNMPSEAPYARYCEYAKSVACEPIGEAEFTSAFLEWHKGVLVLVDGTIKAIA